MNLNNKQINRFLIFLLPIAIFGMFSGANEPIVSILRGTWIEGFFYKLHHGNEIVFSLSIGFLISMFFWTLVVRLPERRKRKIIKNNFIRQYQNFKEGIISILLSASVGSYDSELPSKLCDHLAFKEYFDSNERQNWYDALNGLQGSDGDLNDLLFEMELFAKEITYVLNNVDIDDEKVHTFLKNLSTHVYKLKNSSVYTEDHVKYLGGFVWGILARWDFTQGQQQEDIVQVMIDKI